MATDQEVRLDLYELYLATAEKVSDRRMQASAWMLSVNSAIVGRSTVTSSQGKASVEGAEAMIWRWAIPAAGILVCLSWAALLSSYSKLNGAKFQVLHEMEAELPYALFTREQRFLPADRSSAAEQGGSGGAVELLMVLYAILIAASLVDEI